MVYVAAGGIHGQEKCAAEFGSQGFGSGRKAVDVMVMSGRGFGNDS